MAERYDAAIIGAGADGLAAAAILGRAGLRTILLERHARSGGVLATREFHPGFRSSTYLSDVAPIPPDLFWSLGLARHGALAAPASPATALWPDRYLRAAPLGAAVPRHAAALAASRHVEARPSKWKPWDRPAPAAWPAESWRHASLAEVFAGHSADDAGLLAAEALAGRAADPMTSGSALHLLAAGSGQVWRGGLGGLGDALAAAARAAGAEISCGADVTGLVQSKGRVATLALADGTEIAARAVLSTLDLKRTFLSLFAWNALPQDAVKRIGAFRIAGATARLLVALGTSPVAAAKDAPADLLRGAVHVMPSLTGLAQGHAAWRGGTIAGRLPLALRFESATDPSLAPAGAATLAITAGCVPHTLFDGAWSHDKREQLTARMLARAEQVFPGLVASIVGLQLIAPPDFESELGATAGDPFGGEIAPDQMFALRPGFATAGPRTPVEGLYLAGPSAAAAPFGTCAAGAVAAEALLADIRGGHLP